MSTATISENGRAALELAEQGYRVHPCRADKKAYLEGWPERATTDEDKVTSWWQRWPDALVGVATGRGLVVVDVDGDEGAASLAALTERYGPLPQTRMVRTGGGGYHFWLAVPEGVETRNTASRIGEKIDTRGDGGYVISYGQHKSGRPYEADDTPVADAPAWLLDLLSRKPVDRTAFVPATTSQNTTRYGTRAIELEAQKVATATEGTRNPTLNEAAFALGQLEAGGEIAKGDARDALWQAAMSAGLGEREIEKTIESGLSAGNANPRSAPPRDSPTISPQNGRVLHANGSGADESPANLSDDAAPAVSPVGDTVPEPVELLDWAPLDLSIIGRVKPEPPSISGLFYAGTKHLVFGPHSASKTMLAAHAAVEVVQDGDVVLWLDVDGGHPGDLYERFEQLGLTLAQVKDQVMYLRPEGSLSENRAYVLAELCRERDVRLAVIDSSIGSMSLQGLDPDKATDVNAWWQRVGDHLQGQRAAVVLIAHSGVSADAQNRAAHSARFGTHAAVIFQLRTSESLRRGEPGRDVVGKSSIIVQKDRPSYHPVAHGQSLGDFIVRSLCLRPVEVADDGTIASPGAWTLTAAIRDPSSTPGGAFRPTVLMERASRALEQSATPLSKNALKSLVSGKTKIVLQAIDLLVLEGYFRNTTPDRQAHLLESIRPYRAGSDPLVASERAALYENESETPE
jgi:hypothetical protein